MSTRACFLRRTAPAWGKIWEGEHDQRLGSPLHQTWVDDDPELTVLSVQQLANDVWYSDQASFAHLLDTWSSDAELDNALEWMASRGSASGRIYGHMEIQVQQLRREPNLRRW